MRSIEAFKQIADVVMDAYVITDNDLRILEYNRAFFALFPRQIARKLKGARFSEVLEVERNVAAECLEAGQQVRLDEIPVRLAGSGEELRAIFSGIPLPGDEGAPAGALVILRNVTDEAMIQVKYQEMLETEARARDRLVEQIRERTQALLEANDRLIEARRELSRRKKGLAL